MSRADLAVDAKGAHKTLSTMLLDWCFSGDLERWCRGNMIGKTIGETTSDLTHNNEGHMDALAQLFSGA